VPRDPRAGSPARPAPIDDARGVHQTSLPASGTNRKEHVISATKLLAATALALVALGTPLAQAASDFPPGPTVNAVGAFPPGPSATIVGAYPPGPSVAAAYPPGPTKSIIAI
jgi:hypothetical protein